jgi:hypothetical protein
MLHSFRFRISKYPDFFNKTKTKTFLWLFVFLFIELHGSCQPVMSIDQPFFYRQWRAVDLPTNIGRIEGDGVITDHHGEGFLLYGPYISLPRGCYEVWLKFEIEIFQNRIPDYYLFEVTKNMGRDVINSFEFLRPYNHECVKAISLCLNNSDYDVRKYIELLTKYPVKLGFFLDKDEENLEFRVLSCGSSIRHPRSPIKLKKICLSRVGGSGYELFTQKMVDNQPEAAALECNNYLIGEQNNLREEGRNEVRAALNPQIAQLTAERDSFARRIQELEAQIASVSGNLTHWQSQAGNLDSALNQTRHDLRQTQTSLHQTSTERDQIRAERDQLAWQRDENQRRIAKFEAQKNELARTLGDVSGQLSQTQLENQEKQRQIQEKIDLLNAHQAEIEQKTKELTLQRRKTLVSQDQIKKLLSSKASMERRATNAVEHVRNRSTSASRRANLTLSRIDIRSGAWIDGITPYIFQKDQDVSLGKVGGDGGTLQSLAISDTNPLVKVVFGATNEHGFVSGFGFGFSDGHFVQYGAFHEPRTEQSLTAGEKLIGFFGFASQHVQTLGMITTKGEYGPFGENIDGAEDFSIVPITGKY